MRKSVPKPNCTNDGPPTCDEPVRADDASQRGRLRGVVHHVRRGTHPASGHAHVSSERQSGNGEHGHAECGHIAHQPPRLAHDRHAAPLGAHRSRHARRRSRPAQRRSRGAVHRAVGRSDRATPPTAPAGRPSWRPRSTGPAWAIKASASSRPSSSENVLWMSRRSRSSDEWRPMLPGRPCVRAVHSSPPRSLHRRRGRRWMGRTRGSRPRPPEPRARRRRTRCRRIVPTDPRGPP